MYILAIDPGPEHSGVAIYDSDKHAVICSDDTDNQQLLFNVRRFDDFLSMKVIDRPNRGIINGRTAVMAIEGLENQAHFVGKTTFDTAEWIGRFREALESCLCGEIKSYKISRRDVKICMCGGNTVKNPETGARKTVTDSMVAHAVRSRFPGTGGGKTPEKGTKARPGPLYGVKGSHQYSALAIALTWVEIYGEKTVGETVYKKRKGLK